MEQNNNQNTVDLSIKLVVVGDWGVGKSAFVQRWADNSFNNHQGITIGIDFKTKTIGHSGKTLKILFWDEQPSKRFRRYGPLSFRGAAGAFIMFKLSQRNTFERLQSWFDEVDRQAVKECCKVLIGSCSDLPEEERQVTYQEAKKFAEDHGVRYFEVSAQNGENVIEAVNFAVNRIMSDIDRYVIIHPAPPVPKTGWCSII